VTVVESTDPAASGDATLQELIADNPDLTNREIAEKAGTHVARVRDLRRGDDREASPTTDSGAASDADDAESGPDDATLQELIADNPDLTNREIAEEADTHAARVRDARRDAWKDDGDDASHGDASLQALLAEHPELSNREIAEQAGTHVARVRDLRQGDDREASPTTDSGATSDDDAASGLDDEALRELIADNPALSNREIAEEADTHVARVRDLRAEGDFASGTDADQSGSVASTDAGDSTDEPDESETETEEIWETKTPEDSTDGSEDATEEADEESETETEEIWETKTPEDSTDEPDESEAEPDDATEEADEETTADIGDVDTSDPEDEATTGSDDAVTAAESGEDDSKMMLAILAVLLVGVVLLLLFI
jgi:DNA-binding CsgD family transcriptional regulator